MKPVVSDPLSQVLALPVTEATAAPFMEAVANLVQSTPAKRRGLLEAWDEVPETVRAILALNWLWMVVPNSGIEGFLGHRAFGAEFPGAEKWARRIGASRTAAYLRATIRLCPGAKVPASVEQRRRLLVEFDSRWPEDPLVALDERYRGATEEIPARLQKYLSRHRGEVRKWLAHGDFVPRHSVPAGHRPRRARRGIGVAAPAPKAGMRRARRQLLRPATVEERRRIDSRVEGFLADVAALSPKQWATVAERYGRQLRAMRQGAEMAADVATAIWKRELAPVGRSRRKWLESSERIDTRMRQVIKSLPPTMRVGRSSLPVTRVVAGVACFAVNGMRTYNELMRSAEGRSALKALLGPLEGLITPP